jgi:hypothetical protein
MLSRRIHKEAPEAGSDELSRLHSSVIAFWSAGLLPHFTAESECLLARLVRHRPEDHPMVVRMQRDHLRVEAIVARMRDGSSVDERRSALLELAETLRVHVRWEEESLFPETESALTNDELDALGRDLAERLPETPLPAPL